MYPGVLVHGTMSLSRRRIGEYDVLYCRYRTLLHRGQSFSIGTDEKIDSHRVIDVMGIIASYHLRVFIQKRKVLVDLCCVV